MLSDQRFIKNGVNVLTRSTKKPSAGELRLGTWLGRDFHNRLTTYAEELEFATGSLVGILLARAICLGTLGVALQRANASAQISDRVRVTVSFRSQKGRESFGKLAANSGIGCEAALRALIGVELEERWLERALKLESN